jgi:hypothetical protein
MGGTRRRDTAGAANSLLLHPSCHGWIERNRTAALDMGYLCTQNEDPVRKPVNILGSLVYLTHDGRYVDSVAEIDTVHPL